MSTLYKSPKPYEGPYIKPVTFLLKALSLHSTFPFLLPEVNPRDDEAFPVTVTYPGSVSQALTTAYNNSIEPSPELIQPDSTTTLNPNPKPLHRKNSHLQINGTSLIELPDEAGLACLLVSSV